MSGLLKFITCGSVDDGKSTLIGHILYDSKLLYADQEKALELDSKVGSRGGAIDYSLLLDGLMAEREQGITIDVAYRYFTTDKRSFIVADTPGHEEYTRNMAVGASFADLAVILIDAKQGVLVQTRRHARICALMGIRYFVFAVNKMDLVGYDEKRFNEIVEQINELSSELSLPNITIIPVSATEGDNVTKKSENIPWYEGPALLTYLEDIDIAEDNTEENHFSHILKIFRYMMILLKKDLRCRCRECAVLTTHSEVFRVRSRMVRSTSETRSTHSQATRPQRSRASMLDLTQWTQHRRDSL